MVTEPVKSMFPVMATFGGAMSVSVETGMPLFRAPFLHGVRTLPVGLDILSERFRAADLLEPILRFRSTSALRGCLPDSLGRYAPTTGGLYQRSGYTP